jgi:hypothetical protein
MARARSTMKDATMTDKTTVDPIRKHMFRYWGMPRGRRRKPKWLFVCLQNQLANNQWNALLRGRR